MDILKEIAEKTALRVKENKIKVPLTELKRRIDGVESKKNFEKALIKNRPAFICEVKKASPSKGIISEDFNYIEIALEYEKAGAAAVSVLTEPYWFLGGDKILTQIAEKVTLPVLRKDFVIDEYMIYEAKAIGADAVLLICSLLKGNLSEFLEIASELKLAALVEAKTEDEVIYAAESGAKIIGVNNRNLTDFSVEIKKAERLKKFVPKDCLFVAESGIDSPEIVKSLVAGGADALLVGESFMRAKDKCAEMARLRSIIDES